MINKYIKSSHISERQTRSILKYFSLDSEATKIASLTGVSRLQLIASLEQSESVSSVFANRRASLKKEALSLTNVTLARSEFAVNVSRS